MVTLKDLDSRWTQERAQQEQEIEESWVEKSSWRQTQTSMFLDLLKAEEDLWCFFKRLKGEENKHD